MATKKKATKKKTKKKTRARSIKPREEGNEEMPAEIARDIEAGTVVSPETVIAHAPDSPFAKFEVAKRVAHTLACSNLVPEEYRGKPNDVFVAINMGSELGMEPFQAIQSIAVIEGKPCLYGDGLIGVVRASPKCLWIEESLSEDGTIATCRTHRDGDPNPVERTYSMNDAIQAGINTRYNWKKHPKRMLQMRARAYCLRDAYPDLLKGLGVVEEQRDHEDTPPPVTTYELPKADGGEQPGSPRPAIDDLADEPSPLMQKVFKKYPQGSEITQALVEHAMHQSDSMEELLEAGNLAKRLNEQEQGVCRITYKKMRTALMETGDSNE